MKDLKTTKIAREVRARPADLSGGMGGGAARKVAEAANARARNPPAARNAEKELRITPWRLFR